MSEINGGSAFPRQGGQFHGEHPGMTLRDYFAAKALQGILASDEYSASPASRVAEWAYEQADAMLAAREAK